MTLPAQVLREATVGNHGFDTSVPAARWVETEHEARQWAERYRQSWRRNNGLGIDSETTGLDKQRDVPIIWSLSDAETRLCFAAKFLQLMREQGILENPEIPLDGTNLGFDAHMFANVGIRIDLNGPWRNTNVMSWMYNENNVGRHGLKETTMDHLGRRSPTFEETFGKVPPKKIDKQTGRNINKTVDQLILEKLNSPEGFLLAVDYASLDAYNSTVLRACLDTKLDQISTGWGTLKDLFYSVESPFSKLLWQMERRGITVDAGYLRGLQGPMNQRMEEIEREFAREAGKLVNLNSTNDMRWFFFEHLHKEVRKMTKGGKTGIKKPSTDTEVLEDWAGEGDIWAQLALEYRGISKIEGTYVSGLQKWLDPQYRIHTSLNQTGTVTGRLSSSEPNLQNIPRPDEDRFKIREAFIPGEGKRLLICDYEQLEMRLMAHFSQDQKMIAEIIKGTDLHCYTTSEMEGIPYDEVLAAKKVKNKEDLTERQKELLIKRQANKATGFGIIYGIGGPRLAAQLTREMKTLIPEEQGWSLINKWLNVFPGVRSYMDGTKEWMRKHGFVWTLLGRYRRFGDVRNMNRKDASQAERQAVNSVIQGTAADIAKMAMLKCDTDPELRSLGAELLLQIHDELIFEVPDDDAIADRCTERVKEIMAHPFNFDLLVPIPASGGTGYSWAEAK
jgi:DNA polymerase I